MTAQSSHLISSCAHQLKLVNSIRDILNVRVAERVVNAISTVQEFTCLVTEILQNAAARCVHMRPRNFSAGDMLCELHWNPVRKRVHYKPLLLTYKTLNGSAPNTL